MNPSILLIGALAALGVYWYSMGRRINTTPTAIEPALVAGGGNLPLGANTPPPSTTVSMPVDSGGGSGGITLAQSYSQLPSYMIPTPPTGDWWTTTAQAAAGNMGYAQALDALGVRYTIAMWNTHRRNGGKGDGINPAILANPQELITATQYLDMAGRSGLAGIPAPVMKGWT